MHMMLENAVHNYKSKAPEGLLLKDIRDLLSWFNNASCCFTPRNCNNVAHYASRLCFSKSLSAVWLDNIPSLFWGCNFQGYLIKILCLPSNK